MSKTELVNHPAHYMDKSNIECIDIIDSMYCCSSNAFKYIYRAGEKDDTIQELKKAIWYLNRANNRAEVNIFPFHIKGKVETIADTRHEYIGDAMHSIYYGEWNQAIIYINAYIDYISRKSK
jgi:polyferredoxin